MATTYGADWVVVELRYDGTPFRCWELENVTLTSEMESDGIWWQLRGGPIVHVSGVYDYVQVIDGDWEGAFEQINMTRLACTAVNTAVYSPDSGTYE